MAANYGLDTYGNPPYAEAAAKGQARMTALQRIAMLLAGAGQGIQSVRPGVGPFGNALTGFSRSYILSNASRRAAEDYALKQQQAQEDRDWRDFQKKKMEFDMESQAKRDSQPPKAVPLEDWQRTPEEQAAIIDYQSRLKKATAGAPAGGTEVMSMSDEALTNAAKVYANTGGLPPMGMAKNASGLRVAIMERAAKLYPGGINITQNKANYAKDQRALTQTQQLYDLSTAFEQTASRNGDVMLEAAAGIPDTGTQFGNRIARLAATQMGSPAMARFNAALETLKAEYAKILSSPGSLGGVLTDTARHEMGKVIGGNQTKAQLISSLKILRRDAANKRASYAAKIREIQSRIGPASFGAQNLGGQSQGGDVEWNMDENGNLVPAGQ